MVGPTWTDERIDEKMKSIDATFEMLRDELHGLREDNQRQFGELRAEMVGMRSDLAGVQRQMIQIGFGLVGALLAALVAVILALVT